MRRQLVAGLSAAAVASGLLVAAPTASADSGGSSIDWQPCENQRLAEAGAQCGFVQVPLDYSDPDGKQIKLRVSKIDGEMPEDQEQGVMLVNPGGPGGSGLTLPVINDLVPKNAGEHYDWIGFDPRGVGRSEPRLNCIPGYNSYDRPPYVPRTELIEAAWLARAKRYADACAADEPALLPHMKTTDTVRDMNRIREALGEEQINFYGFSYGTYLGQVFATMFPDRMRRMVLDSNVNPKDIWYEANLNQDIAFDRNAQVWFDWLAQYNEVFGLGDSGAEVEELYYQVLSNLNEQAAGGKIGGAEWTDLFLAVGYSQFAWESLGHLFANYVRTQNPQPLIEAYGDPAKKDDNGYAVYLAVECTDADWPHQWSKWEKDNWRIYAEDPFETWGNAWFNAPCFFWEADPGKPVNVKSKQEALLISGTLDAATPYEGSLSVRKKLKNSRLIALAGETTHAASLYGNACVDNRIADYLLTGALPARKPGANTADVRCPQLPDPVPSKQNAQAAQQDTAKSAARTVLRQATRPMTARMPTLR